MAKAKMISKIDSSNKIKIPAYISEPINEDAYVYETYDAMVDELERRIKNYNKGTNRIGNRIKGETIERQITHIDYARYKDGEKPILLIRIVEQKTGYTDLEIDGSKNAIPVDPRDILRSKYNCAVLYPNIDTKGDKIANNWLTFIYVDPGKTDTDVINTVKTVLERIFELKIKNIKRKAANELLKKSVSIPKLTAQYVNVRNNEEDSLNIGGVQVSATIKEVKNFVFEDIPSENVEEYVNSKEDKIPYLSKNITVSLADKQDLKYIHKKKGEELLTIKDVIEQMYNYETDIKLSEFDKMYEPGFILKKVKEASLKILGNE